MCVGVKWLPARFEARQSHNAAILSVYLKHALRLKLLGKRQHVIGVAVGCVNATYLATWEGICCHDNEDFQGGNSRFVLTVPYHPQKYPGRRSKSWLTRVTCLRDQNKITVRYSNSQVKETEVKFCWKI